jgi:hypothetical protein
MRGAGGGGEGSPLAISEETQDLPREVLVGFSERNLAAIADIEPFHCKPGRHHGFARRQSTFDLHTVPRVAASVGCPASQDRPRLAGSPIERL